MGFILVVEDVGVHKQVCMDHTCKASDASENLRICNGLVKHASLLLKLFTQEVLELVCPQGGIYVVDRFCSLIINDPQRNTFCCVWNRFK